MTTVELLDLIKSRLEKTEKEPIVKALGYINKQKGLKRLDALIYTNSTEDWLRKSGYDLVHSNKSFLIKLSAKLLIFFVIELICSLVSFSKRLSSVSNGIVFFV